MGKTQRLESQTSRHPSEGSSGEKAKAGDKRETERPKTYRRTSSQRSTALLLLAIGSGIGAAALIAADPGGGPAARLAQVSERRERVACVEARRGALLLVMIVRGSAANAGDAVLVVAVTGRGRNSQGTGAAGHRGHRGARARVGDAAAGAGGRCDGAVGGWLERSCGMKSQ